MDKKTALLTIILVFITFYSIGYGFYKYIVLGNINYYTENSDSSEGEPVASE